MNLKKLFRIENRELKRWKIRFKVKSYGRERGKD